MSPHPHLIEFDMSRICLYKQVHLFCFAKPATGGAMLRELIEHKNGVFEDLLILVKVKDKLYRYVSPQPLDAHLSQVQLAYIIRNRLGKTSNRHQFLEKIASMFR